MEVLKLKKGIPMFSMPKTETEEEFANLHKPELKVYGLSSFATQLIWIGISISVIIGAITNVVVSGILTTCIALLFLTALHFALHTTYHVALNSTWKQKSKGLPIDRWAWVMPILLSVILLGIDIVGNVRLANDLAYKAQENQIDHTSYDNRNKESTLRYSADSSQIAAKYARLSHNLAAGNLAEISRLQKRTIISDNDAAWVKKLITQQKAEVVTKTGKQQQKMFAELAQLRLGRDTMLAQTERQRQLIVTTTLSKNTEEKEKERISEKHANYGGIAMAFVFFLVFGGTNARIAYIRHKSGIEYQAATSPADVYGGNWNFLLHVLSDITNRKFYTIVQKWHEDVTTPISASFKEADSSYSYKNTSYNKPENSSSDNEEPNESRYNTDNTQPTDTNNDNNNGNNLAKIISDINSLMGVNATDFSNLKNGNGTPSTILGRIDKRLSEIQSLLAANQEVKITAGMQRKYELQNTLLNEARGGAANHD